MAETPGALDALRDLVSLEARPLPVPAASPAG